MGPASPIAEPALSRQVEDERSVKETVSGAHPRDRLERRLSLFDATLLVVASVIGAGIFLTPGRVAELLPHPCWIMAAWLMGGLLSLVGALANSELAAMFPRAGGDYVYLREGVHPLAGFLVGWFSFFGIYAGTIAALAAAFAVGLAGRLGLGEASLLPLAIGVTATLSLVNYLGVRWGALANNLTSLFKLGALFAFVILGPWVGEGDFSRLFELPLETAGGEGRGAAWPSFAAFGMAMSPVLFSYLGWNASVYVASEIRSPGRNLPRSLFLGLALCGGIYLLINGVYLYALPMDELRGVPDAGQAAAQALFGGVGGQLLGSFVILSVLGSLNAMILVGPRIAYAMALDGLFFGGAERVNDAFRTPGRAIIVQGVLACALLLVLRSFPSALDFATFAILLATMADMVALYRLRVLQPDRHRPYRAWGYPVLPALYFVANGAVALALLVGRPYECGISLLLLVLGLPFYWFFARGEGSGGATPRGNSPVM
jgi:APA family basic amino acid/polyamine antiporter